MPGKLARRVYRAADMLDTPQFRQPHIADTSYVADAAELLRLHGADAAHEAANRAFHARSLGNHIHFARWKQIERLIVMLGDEAPRGTLH